MGKKIDEPLPFTLLKQFPTKTWGLCDKCMELKPVMKWNDLCILPIGAGLSIADELGIDIGTNCYRISALYAWRKYKEIYSFDDYLADLLIDQADQQMDIPIDILLQLPYPCIYIQYKNIGFFAHFEHDVNNNHFEFRFWYLEPENDVSIPIILHIEEKCTIDEAIEKSFDESGKRMTPEFASMIRQVTGDVMKKKAAELLQFVLYICAENSEREEDPEQKKITRRSKESAEKPKDVFREIRKWDVGYRIGSQIRRMKSEQKADSDAVLEGNPERTTRKSGRKSPHARRGHWHHFWIGKHETNERKLILKWVAPMFINGSEDDNVATIHPVK